MKRYILDTNTVSHFLKEHPNVVHHVISVPMSSLYISAITEGELLFGLAKRPEAKKLHLAVKEMLRRIDVLPWTGGSLSECYGAARANLERHGKTLAPLDLLIASHALSENSILVTNDKAFSLVDGLKVEDWTTI